MKRSRAAQWLENATGPGELYFIVQNTSHLVNFVK